MKIIRKYFWLLICFFIGGIMQLLLGKKRTNEIFEEVLGKIENKKRN